jgi:hypothetical protein
MADDTKKLNDILQGLVTTDQKVIEKINTDVTELEDKVSRGSGSYGLADINSPNVTSNGKLINDMGASHGKAYSVTTSSQNLLLYSGEFSDVKFGKYAMCLRIKSSSVTSSNILQIRVSNGSTIVLSKDIKGSNFSSANKYGYVYTTFDYEGDGVVKNNLKIEVYTHTVSGITICFDYAYIGMIIPAVFL